MKIALAQASGLGDPMYDTSVSEAVAKMLRYVFPIVFTIYLKFKPFVTPLGIFIQPCPLLLQSPSKSQASQLRQMIDDSQAFPVGHYTSSFTLENGATAAQVMVMGPDDLIVSVMR